MKKIIRCLLGILGITIIVTSCSKKEENSEPICCIPAPEVLRVDTFTYLNAMVDTFTFVYNDIESEGLIYLPEGYESNGGLPAIYLIDFQEQHFDVVTDEYAQLIHAVREKPNFDALVVSLKALPSIDAYPSAYQDYSDVIKDMSYHVDSIYTDNTSKTLVARGSEGGVVLLTLLHEDPEENVFENYIATDSPTSFNSTITDMIESGTIPSTMLDKKLHFSYSESNNFDSCNELINSFEEAQYPWLTFQSMYYGGLYTSVYPDVFAAGLEFVFE